MKPNQAHGQFHKTEMASCNLLGGSLPSVLPDVLPWALESSTLYSSLSSPLVPSEQRRRNGLDLFPPQGANFLSCYAPGPPLGILNNHATPSKEQKENPRANGKRFYPGNEKKKHLGNDSRVGYEREGIKGKAFPGPPLPSLQPLAGPKFCHIIWQSSSHVSFGKLTGT